MSLWKNIDAANGYGKPLFANTTNVWSSSTINGAKANTNKYYGVVYGVSSTETTAASNPNEVQHAGWVSQKIGTGPVIGAVINNGGTGINAAGYLLITDNSVLATGNTVLFNASFTIANSQNTLQSYSTNSTLNAISSITIHNGSLGFSESSKINVRTNGSNTTWPNITLVLGGRGDRINYETIVAMGSITGDDPRDNSFFSGI